MNEIRTTSKWLRISLVCCAAVALSALGPHSPALAGGSPSAREAPSSWNIVGAWSVAVTLRDCVTQAPLGPPIQSLVTYHRGGTIQETTSALVFAPNQRSEGHGSWTRMSRKRYHGRMITLIRFETAPQPPFPGFLAGWQVIDHAVTLVDPDNMTSKGTAKFYDTENQLYRTGCSTSVGRRFE